MSGIIKLVGNAAKLLKEKLTLKDGASIISVSVDPSAVAVFGEIGDFALSTSTGGAYMKTDVGTTTNWSQLLDTGSVGDMLKSVYDPNDDGIIAIAQGGTGASTAANARTALGLGTAATQASSTFATASHTHAQSDITDLVSDLAGKAASSHVHAAADITSGTVATARLGSGTANSGTYLRGDQTWAAPSSSDDTDFGCIKNGKLSMSVAANALTIAVVTAAGATPSVGDPVRVAVRDSALTDSSFSHINVTSALSITIPSGTSLGLVGGSNGYIFVHVLNNAGALELCVSGRWLDDTQMITTTTLATAPTTAEAKSTTARSAMPFSRIARLRYTTAPNGTYTATPDEVQLQKAGTDLFPEFFGGQASTPETLDGTDSEDWVTYVGNDVYLQPGFYTVQGGATLYSSGTGNFVNMYFKFHAANGAFTAPEPTDITASYIKSGANRLTGVNGFNITDGAIPLVGTPFLIYIPTGMSIYANSNTKFSGSGGLVVATYSLVQRVKGPIYANNLVT